jgi:hypothetical protein
MIMEITSIIESNGPPHSCSDRPPVLTFNRTDNWDRPGRTLRVD